MKKTTRCEPKGIVSTTAEKNLKALRAAVIERIGNTCPQVRKYIYIQACPTKLPLGQLPFIKMSRHGLEPII